MQLWVIYVLIYGILKGSREGLKKIATSKNSVMEVLFLYTLLGFVLIIPFSVADGLLSMPLPFYFYIFVKSAVIFFAWILAFGSIKKMPVSMFGVIDLVRVVFSTLAGVLILHETLGKNQIIGLVLVVLGILAVNIKKSDGKHEATPTAVLMVVASCLLNAVSGTMDKVLMKTINSSQLQFWFMLYLLMFYGAYMLISNTPVKLSTLKTNKEIIWLSVLFVLGDKLLFIANHDPNSKVTIMTLLKQSSVIAAIITGRLMFREKNIMFKLLCSAVVIIGIVISVI